MTKIISVIALVLSFSAFAEVRSERVWKQMACKKLAENYTVNVEFCIDNSTVITNYLQHTRNDDGKSIHTVEFTGLIKKNSSIVERCTSHVLLRKDGTPEKMGRFLCDL